ncbi:hypothetical protein H5410_021409 [Solanum commersonii]|uniref:Uncharacterized protein n=1 Tax=Solanum commersonii TaxID=4109 RepID=A0A9J5ZE70_SOLCO|nr:hypothetical protein H5410_021409 [Solanum commersonii]
MIFNCQGELSSKACIMILQTLSPRLSSSGKRSQVQPPHHEKRSLVYKWRRVERRDHYPPSLEGYDCSKGWVTDRFLATLYLKLWNSLGTSFIFLISKCSALLDLIESFLTTKSSEGLRASQLACRVNIIPNFYVHLSLASAFYVLIWLIEDGFFPGLEELLTELRDEDAANLIRLLFASTRKAVLEKIVPASDNKK